MSTTIHTIEDLMQVLDENPEWLEAMRARLLTRELTELPERFNKFVAEMKGFVAEMNAFVAEMNAFVAEMKGFVAEMKGYVAETNRRLDNLESGMKSVQNDIGIIKGILARNAALEEVTDVAREMGLRRRKNLSRDDLWDLIDEADTSGIPTNELRSFRRADLIMEATDRDRATCYVAVEISYTANGRDTTRALRNAGFLTKFTGRRSHAAVAGLFRDERIQHLIDSGEVAWYRLDPQVLEAE